MSYTKKQILDIFKKTASRVQTHAGVKFTSKDDFALYYTPGVGVVSRHLAAHPKDARILSVKKNSVAVISDGSAVLGLGNIGPYGALPVMEGKALIFKQLAGVDAWPIVLDTQDTDEIVKTIQNIAPAFGGINLEDIAAPQCFEIERRLIESLSIPVMHDDQHGTAIVVLAGLINAALVTGKHVKKLRVVISGAGAAGTGVAVLLHAFGITDIIMLDRTGTLYTGRDGMNAEKISLAAFTNPRRITGGVRDALTQADVFIGLSGSGALLPEDIKLMAEKSIVFALANPVPEIMPDVARRAGAQVIATGRSDFPNQINNALVFPGIFRGALDRGVREITTATKLRAAKALAGLVAKPTATKLLPDLLDKRVVPAIAAAVK